MRYVIESSQKFTKTGSLGAWLFVCAPILVAIGLVWLSKEQRSYSPDPAVPALVIGVASIGFLLGAVLIVVGRTQTHTVSTVEVHGSKGSGGQI
ncbi:hypothetical protein [Rhizobium sp. Leaf383]|uniref:hypothetical protein n=1 Tax=Rhizobium sp. Leaf383 TaxID=1736357 RepID=UPI0007138AC8|nr:hypothetical protein [Rhizobium sp. Leaf383]KQS83418.1 hypothetical protein ASG58_22040 [Rhizobium sp. Leaf383]